MNCWELHCEALGREDWFSDPRFDQRSSRKVHAGELVTEIEVELAKKTAVEWEPILQSAGVPCARLRSLPEALESDQVKKRGFVQSLDDETEVPTLPFRLGQAKAYRPVSRAPKHGEHSDEILNWLAKSNSADEY